MYGCRPKAQLANLYTEIYPGGHIGLPRELSSGDDRLAVAPCVWATNIRRASNFEQVLAANKKHERQHTKDVSSVNTRAGTSRTEE